MIPHSKELLDKLSQTKADRSHTEDVQIKSTVKRDIQTRLERYPDATKLQDRVGLLEAENSELKRPAEFLHGRDSSLEKEQEPCDLLRQLSNRYNFDAVLTFVVLA